jgi:hypothetical protein
VVDLRLHLNPPGDRHAGDIQAVIRRQLVDPQGAELRVLQPWVPEALEGPVVHVRVDESQHDVIVG